MPADRPHIGPAQAALAVLLPLLVVAGALLFYGRPMEAGLSERAARIEAQVASANPDVVVVGNSLGKSGIDTDQLSRGLGDDPSVLHVWIESSLPPTWYALLDNRVYGTGHRPKLVIVANALEWMLAVEPVSDLDRQRLMDQMDADDVLLLRKSLGQDVGNAWLHRLRTRRTAFRNELMDLLREVPTGLVFGRGAEGGLRERGRAVAGPALEQVFAGEAVDEALYRRAVPIVEAERAREGAARRAVGDSLVPDLIDLAHANGSQIVFLRLPLPPGNTRLDRLGPETERAFLELLNARGAGWVDLSGLELGESAFSDRLHLNAAGRLAVTRAAAEALLALGVFGDGPLAGAVLPLVPSTVERVGAPPALPPLGPPKAIAQAPCAMLAAVPGMRALSDDATEALGLGAISPVRLLQGGEPLPQGLSASQVARGCAAGTRHVAFGLRFVPRGGVASVDPASLRAELSPDFPLVTDAGARAYWVYPGTTARFVFDEPWDASRGPFAVGVLAERIGGGRGAPVVRVSGQEVAGLQRAGATFRALYAGDAPAGGWSVEITSPADGPYLAIRGLWTGEGDAAYHVISDRRGGGVEVRLVGRSLTGVEHRFDAAPQPLVAGPPTFEGAFGVLESPALRVLAAGMKANPTLRKCNPVRVLEDGASVFGLGRCDELAPGRACHVGKEVRFVPPTGAEGHQYTLGLDPERACAVGRWLYPGDTLRAVTEPSFRVGADRFELSGLVASNDPGAARMRVTLRAGDRVFVEDDVPLAALASGAVTWDFNDRVPLAAKPVVLELSLPADGPAVLLASASLGETRPFEDLSGPPRGPARLFDRAAPPEAPAPGPRISEARVSRVGEPPSLRAGPARPDGPCRRKLPAPELTALGDAALRPIGASSPVRVREAGVALAPRAGGPDFSGCEGTFLHWKEFVYVAGREEAPGEVALALAEEVPVRTPGGPDLWWVYPGTSLVFTPTEPGDLRVRVLGRGFGGGAAAPTLRVGEGAPVPLGPVGARWRGEIEGEGPVVVSSPADGPFLLLDAVAPVGATPWAGDAAALDGARLLLGAGEVHEVPAGGTARLKCGAKGTPPPVYGPARLTLTAEGAGLTAVLRRGTEILLERALDPASLDGRPHAHAVPLEAPVRCGQLSLELRNTGGGPVRVRDAALSEHLAWGR